METLLALEKSRRVLKIDEGKSLLSSTEGEITERFPIRYGNCSSRLNPPPVLERPVYFLQKHTTKWGLVDVTEVDQTNSGDEIRLTKISNKAEVCLAIYPCVKIKLGSLCCIYPCIKIRLGSLCCIYPYIKIKLGSMWI